MEGRGGPVAARAAPGGPARGAGSAEGHRAGAGNRRQVWAQVELGWVWEVTLGGHGLLPLCHVCTLVFGEGTWHQVSAA